MLVDRASTFESCEQLTDFNLSAEKDIILCKFNFKVGLLLTLTFIEMLAKSLTMFNFVNISNSLYDLYLSQFGKTNLD